MQDRPPEGDASYGHNLNYWIMTLGLSDRDIADELNINRTYPGKIRKGSKLPTSDVADAIREHLLKTARAPGPYGHPPLTESDRHLMDERLRTSFAREDRARRAKRPTSSVGTGQGHHAAPAGERKPIPAGSTASAGNTSTRAAATGTFVHRRASIHPLATICLIVLALALPFAGVVYYVTHASTPTSGTPPALTPQQLYRAITAGHPVLIDPLTAPSANGWDEGPQPGGGCAYSGGAYHSTVLHSAVIQCLPGTMPPFRSSGTFAVQVDVTFLKGDGGAGLVFGYAGPRAPYYRFVVRPDGYFDLFDPWTAAVSTGPSLAPGARYRLTAIVRATDISLYINGVPEGQFVLDSAVTVDGKAGVFAVNGVHNPTDAVFHNFTVWEFPSLR